MVSIVPFGETIRIQYDDKFPLQVGFPSLTFTCLSTMLVALRVLGNPETVTVLVNAVAQLLFESQVLQPDME
jgi:hypothetical protein